MYVHLKQSGELLAAGGDLGELWTPDGVRVSTEKIATAHHQRDRLGMQGLMIVSGAGNIIRGDKLRQQRIGHEFEDFLGRQATIMNTVVLAARLKGQKIPIAAFIADTMSVTDISIPSDMFQPYEIEAICEAYDNERVVLVAGGTGEDNKTTDNAVLEYARRHREQRQNDEVLVLKGTKHDGVYDQDPQKYADARRFKRISAYTMLDDYERYAVVDRDCLVQICTTGLSLRVYRDNEHDFTTAVKPENGGVGTLIVADTIEPEYADVA